MIKRESLSETIVKEIKQRIQSGEYREGDQLPRQDRFAARLGVSRVTLREALNTLQKEGLVVTKSGRGTFIRSSVVLLPASLPDFLNNLDVNSVRDLFEFRLGVEATMAALCAERAQRSEIDHIKNFLSLMEKEALAGDPQKYVAHDSSFHAAIAKGSHNSIYIQAYEGIMPLISEIIKNYLTIFPAGYLRRSLRFHEAVYRAISQRNREEAFEQMQRHGMENMEVMEKLFQDSRSGHVV